MAAPTDANGTIKYWVDGLPLEGVLKSTQAGGTMQFWVDGLPFTIIINQTAPAVTATASNLMMMGV